MFERYRSVSIEKALNSRVSTGGSQPHAGVPRDDVVEPEALLFTFRCLARVPRISPELPRVQYEGKTFDPDRFLFLEEEKEKPVEFARGVHWRNFNVRCLWKGEAHSKETAAHRLQLPMTYAMIHLAGAVASFGVCMIGGLACIRAMEPYFTTSEPAGFEPGNLPSPRRDSDQGAVECIERLSGEQAWGDDEPDPATTGQLLWAGYGCTPHGSYLSLLKRQHPDYTPYRAQGKTVPSGSCMYRNALHCLTRTSLARYVNWDEEAERPTHSLAEEAPAGAWKRLYRALTGLERAPVVISCGRGVSEAGMSALYVALQAQAVGCSAKIVALSRADRDALRNERIEIDPTCLVLVGPRSRPAPRPEGEQER